MKNIYSGSEYPYANSMKNIATEICTKSIICFVENHRVVAAAFIK
jgi:hypothetical protein